MQPTVKIEPIEEQSETPTPEESAQQSTEELPDTYMPHNPEESAQESSDELPDTFIDGASDLPEGSQDWEGGVRATDREPRTALRFRKRMQTAISARKLQRSQRKGLDGLAWKLNHLARKPPSDRGRDSPYPQQHPTSPSSPSSSEPEYEDIPDDRGIAGAANLAATRARRKKKSLERSQRAKAQGQRKSGAENSRGGFAKK